jgi:predicted transcriptional regulator
LSGEGSLRILSSINPERRTNLEIIASILNACHCGAKKTYMMSQCNMSSKQLTGYLDLLLEANLLLIKNNGRHPLFKVSNKGKDFLNAYETIKAMME